MYEGQMNLAGSLRQDQQTRPTNPVTSIAEFAGEMFRSSHMGTTKSCGIFNEIAIFPGSNVCALKHLGGVFDFHGNPLNDYELEQQTGKIKKSPLLVRDC